MAFDLTSVLADAGPLNCMTPGQREMVLTQLINIIAYALQNGGGGGGGGTTRFTGYYANSLREETYHVGGPRPSIAYLVGVSTFGDSGQGFFGWKDTETGQDDGVSIIRAADVPYPTAGAWVRLS